jgi:hypothetical protein
MLETCQAIGVTLRAEAASPAGGTSGAACHVLSSASKQRCSLSQSSAALRPAASQYMIHSTIDDIDDIDVFKQHFIDITQPLSRILQREYTLIAVFGNGDAHMHTYSGRYQPAGCDACIVLM